MKRRFVMLTSIIIAGAIFYQRLKSQAKKIIVQVVNLQASIANGVINLNVQASVQNPFSIPIAINIFRAELTPIDSQEIIGNLVSPIQVTLPKGESQVSNLGL